MQTEEIFSKLNELKNNYYDNNGGKNMFFKKKQKMEIARTICSQFDLPVLLRKTFFLVNTTDIVFIDYKLFKLYANPLIYQSMVDYLIFLFNATISKYGRYSVYFDVDTITPSATERYKELVILFNSHCINTNFVNYLFCWALCNIPQYVDTFLNIVSGVIDPRAMNSLKKYNKEESIPLLKNLMELGDDVEILNK